MRSAAGLRATLNREGRVREETGRRNHPEQQEEEEEDQEEDLDRDERQAEQEGNATSRSDTIKEHDVADADQAEPARPNDGWC